MEPFYRARQAFGKAGFAFSDLEGPAIRDAHTGERLGNHESVP
jgi:hypothetical protein